MIFSSLQHIDIKHGLTVKAESAGLDLDKNILSLFLHFESFLLNGWVEGADPRDHIKRPAVPGTGDNRSIEPALGQGPSLMGADMADGTDFAAHFEERNLLPPGLDTFPGVDRDLRLFRYLDKFTHPFLPLEYFFLFMASTCLIMKHKANSRSYPQMKHMPDPNLTDLMSREVAQLYSETIVNEH